MTSKEIIRRVVRYDKPPRIGFDFLPPYPNDILGIMATEFISQFDDRLEWGEYPDVKVLVPGFTGQVCQDCFGNIYGRLNEKTKGECLRGALQEDFSAVEQYQLPKPDGARNQKAKQYAAANADKFVIAGSPVSVFSTFRDLRRMDNALMDLLLEPEYTRLLLDKLLALALDIVDIDAGLGADALIIYDDWGMQNTTFISPDAFRSFFKLMYKAIADRLHEHGMLLFLHSCGNTKPLIEDFIEAGVDVLQYDQPEVYGFGELAHDYGGRVAFYCPVDIQKVAASGNRELIERKALEMVNAFKGLGGGFIAKDYPSWEDINVLPQWAKWARDVFLANAAY
jgi:uroporphyrinogen decarboxylase